MLKANNVFKLTTAIVELTETNADWAMHMIAIAATGAAPMDEEIDQETVIAFLNKIEKMTQMLRRAVSIRSMLYSNLIELGAPEAAVQKLIAAWEQEFLKTN